MRDYATITPTFWTGETGRKIRLLGSEAQVVALYLMTCPSSNMIGLYYLPIILISHETGLSAEGSSKALASLSEAGFCAYDHESEMVWVIEMAKHQIAEELSPKDNRVKWIRGELKKCAKTVLLHGFMERYRECFHLENQPEKASPFEAPSKPGTGTRTDKDILPGETSEDSSDKPPAEKISLPCEDGSEYVFPDKWLATMRDAHPLADIPVEARKARAWLESSPERKPTRRGMKKFFNYWLGKAQTWAAQKATATAPPPTRGRKATAADAGPAPWTHPPDDLGLAAANQQP